MPHATRRTGLISQVQIRKKKSLSGSSPPGPVSFRACLFRCCKRHQKWPFTYERSESQTSASKHLEPMSESVKGPAGLEAESVAAQLWEHTLGFGRSTQAAGAGHTALHSVQTCTGALPLHPTHRGCSAFTSQPLHAGMGQMLVLSHLLSPHLLPFPLPLGTNRCLRHIST